ncbi:MAG: glutamine synthetase, partial [Ignisphaera sp.]
MKSVDEVLKRIEEDNVNWILLQFTDLLGSLRQVTISRFVNTLVGRFDGSSVKGFANIEESDLSLKPDFSTYALIPWSNSTARLICDVYLASTRLSKDPRYVAQKVDNILLDQET